MERLTKKDKDHIGGYAPNGTYDTTWKANAFDKLGKYEDIEEFCEKVTKEKVYHKLNTTDGTIISCDTYENCYVLYNFKTKEIELYSNYYDLFDCSFKIDEYGKTWAFTRKELKNEL